MKPIHSDRSGGAEVLRYTEMPDPIVRPADLLQGSKVRASISPISDIAKVPTARRVGATSRFWVGKWREKSFR